ncbi:GNAT family N-acetyltransferase [Chitinophaga silvatica]|uniref:GNAT family N-acetyltransferase n=1 Tax=Chitinophaga silvatica TaxID=2282649 RepID=A0A3E1YAP0_9BACT|nr:GNAT family N-acetyltransferase [Chitinophaga silvatica]RFS22706.1 GNAT family N-acetyltransferase [Chitinophaga silvatica]
MIHIINTVAEKEYIALVEVWEASVRATHHFLSEADIQFFKPLILNEYLKAVELFCVKSDSGEILGFIGIAENKVEMLFIDPVVRGQGIGKALLQYAIKEKAINAVDVNEQNEQAVGFYLHEGFKVTGRSAVDGMGKPFPILFMEL